VRTTLNLDPDIRRGSRKLASTREQSLGEVISALARMDCAPVRRLSGIYHLGSRVPNHKRTRAP